MEDFRIWLTPCVVTSWKDLQLKIIHFYRGIATFKEKQQQQQQRRIILGISRNINPSKEEWQHQRRSSSARLLFSTDHHSHL